MNHANFSLAIRRALIVLWVVLIALFTVVQVVQMMRGDQTGIGVASELLLLGAVVAIALMTGRSIGKRRFGRAGMAIAPYVRDGQGDLLPPRH